MQEKRLYGSVFRPLSSSPLLQTWLLAPHRHQGRQRECARPTPPRQDRAGSGVQGAALAPPSTGPHAVGASGPCHLHGPSAPPHDLERPPVGEEVARGGAALRRPVQQIRAQVPRQQQADGTVQGRSRCRSQRTGPPRPCRPAAPPPTRDCAVHVQTVVGSVGKSVAALASVGHLPPWHNPVTSPDSTCTPTS